VWTCARSMQLTAWYLNFQPEIFEENQMTSLKSIREELKELQKDILAKHSKPAEATIVGAPADFGDHKTESMLEHQIGELNRMVKTMLDEAEGTVADHPVATVSGALALGIVIGRLTAR
jgi:ElaB/YqjD/DUF883 family membrane-anchored ribosome-binding protein